MLCRLRPRGGVTESSDSEDNPHSRKAHQLIQADVVARRTVWEFLFAMVLDGHPLRCLLWMRVL